MHIHIYLYISHLDAECKREHELMQLEDGSADVGIGGVGSLVHHIEDARVEIVRRRRSGGSREEECLEPRERVLVPGKEATDSSSDSASHTHSAQRPSAAALLMRSRGGGLTTPLAHSHTQTHTLSYGIAMGVYPLSLSLSLSDALLGSWQL